MEQFGFIYVVIFREDVDGMTISEDPDQTAEVRARGYKTLFMLISAEHEILNAQKYKDIKKFSFYRPR